VTYSGQSRERAESNSTLKQLFAFGGTGNRAHTGPRCHPQGGCGATSAKSMVLVEFAQFIFDNLMGDIEDDGNNDDTSS